MDPIENLRTLHGEEEMVRVQSLTTIEQRADLHDHLAIIAETMNLIWAFSLEHTYQDDDELTMQLLGIRLFNAAAVSVKLALSGYYQKGLVHLRDVIETGFLIDYLTTCPDKIPEWKAADKKTARTCSALLRYEKRSTSGIDTQEKSARLFTISSRKPLRTRRIEVLACCSTPKISARSGHSLMKKNLQSGFKTWQNTCQYLLPNWCQYRTVISSFWPRAITLSRHGGRGPPNISG